MTARRRDRAPGAAALTAGVVLAAALSAGVPLVASGAWAGPVSHAPARPAAAAMTVASRDASTNPGDSLDWAGYAVSGVTVSAAGGTWTQPTAVCPAHKTTQSAFWVGIDGYQSTDPTVQQVGTDADCTKGTGRQPGTPSYYAWYELYPDPIVVLPTGNHPVAPGNVLTGHVSESGTTVTLSIVDVGHWSYSTVQVAPTAPLGASAEWIAEAPTVCATKCKPVPLTPFGSVAFSGASADGLPVDAPGYVDHQITMTKNKKGTIVKASTSPLSGGNSFVVSWIHS